MSFKYEGWLTYQDMPRRGDRARVTLIIGLFPPNVTVTVHDPIYGTNHTLTNSRFNFQSRDSLVDLLARDSWQTDWIDLLDGDMHLIMPTITSMTQTLRVTLFASWWPAFCIIDFQQGNDYCQIATRPRTLMQARWTRRDVAPERFPGENTTAAESRQTESPRQPDPENEVPPVIHQPALADEADSPYDIDFENAENHSKTLNRWKRG